jgi:hypothetical protein
MTVEQSQDLSHNISRPAGCVINDFKIFQKFKYVGTTLTDRNEVHDEINTRINSGNIYYNKVRKLPSYHLLSKTLYMRIYRTIIWPFVLYGCETWFLTMKKEHKLQVSETRVLRKVF